MASEASVLALFVSPHGLGHAARICAVAEALGALRRAVRFEVFTRAPRWIFEQSLTADFGYTELLTDIGLVQDTALAENLGATLHELDSFLPFDEHSIEAAAVQLKEGQVDLVVCDIAALGIVAAREAGIPSVLIENFTWDWVYGEYARQHQDFARHAEYLGSVYDTADCRVRAEPTCGEADADLVVSPIGRVHRQLRSEVREALGIPEQSTAILVTMGGVPEELCLDRSDSLPPDMYLVIPGPSKTGCRHPNVVCVPPPPRLYHPDLVNACDAVLGKLGYSTVAEAYNCGVPLGYVSRPSFPEFAVLERFVTTHLNTLELPRSAWASGEWVTYVGRLAELARRPARQDTGAAEAAAFISSLLESLS
jgi:UDP:flavonoid glycosyltransferase YjiC (YdhE family)